jgi:hypothetical protein
MPNSGLCNPRATACAPLAPVDSANKTRGKQAGSWSPPLGARQRPPVPLLFRHNGCERVAGGRTGTCNGCASRTVPLWGRTGRLGVGGALALALLLLAPLAPAQILNLEKQRLDRKEDEFFVGNAGANFNYNNRSPSLREPVRVLSTGATSNLAFFHASTGLLLINDYQLLTVNENTIVSTGLSHLRVQLERRRWLHYELYNQFQYDRPRGLRSRGLFGANGRLFLLQTTPADVILGLGPMYETERWAHPFEADRFVQVNFLKLNSYVSTRVALGGAVDLNGITYYQVGRDRTFARFRHRVSGELNLTAGIGERFSLTSSLSLAYETAPIVPIVPFVFATTNGLRVNF